MCIRDRSINAPGPVIAVPTPKTKKATFNIQTSVLRPNPLQKKTKLGYNSNFQFISFFNNGKIAGSTSPKIGIWGEDSGKVICSYDTEAVSYTHLDVYKRQAQHPDIVAKFRQLMEESSTPDPNRVGL